MSKKRKINIVTLGCSKNVVDSEFLMKQLDSDGWEVVHDSDDTSAKVVVINTCGFIADAKEESTDTILRFVNAKNQGVIERVYVMGCLSQRYKTELEGEIPEVDGFYGVTDLPVILKDLKSNYHQEDVNKRILTTPKHYAYLKISEGCNWGCGYCAIPLIRGKHISRKMESLIEEATQLAKYGVKELLIIAQDSTYYGLDIYGKRRLPELIEQLSKINGIEWIRIHYAYPSNFPMELISVIKNNPKVCKYLDIPFQHISDNMLKVMRRGLTKSETIDLVAKLRTEVPDIAIRTTFLVGHPGETEADFNGKFIIHEGTLAQIASIFSKRGLELTELNRKQAEVPNCCTVLPNLLGTAPGMWFEQDGKILISLPGVPFEMVGLMQNEVLPRLSKMNEGQVVVHRTIQTFGLPESFLADKLSQWEGQLPKNIKLAYLPSPTSIRLRLSAYGTKNIDLGSIINVEVEKLGQVIPKYIFGEGDDSLQSVVGQMLKQKSATLSTAESCTGGTISQLITQIPGSSAYFKGCVVAYSNQVKEEILGVDPELIRVHGAVSIPVVEAMAKGVKSRLKSNYAIAVSGIAGPDGGSEAKPVGTICIAIISDKSLISNTLMFTSDRTRNIIRASATALNMLRLMLIDENL